MSATFFLWYQGPPQGEDWEDWRAAKVHAIQLMKRTSRPHRWPPGHSAPRSNNGNVELFDMQPPGHNIHNLLLKRKRMQVEAGTSLGCFSLAALCVVSGLPALVAVWVDHYLLCWLWNPPSYMHIEPRIKTAPGIAPTRSSGTFSRKGVSSQGPLTQLLEASNCTPPVLWTAAETPHGHGDRWAEADLSYKHK